MATKAESFRYFSERSGPKQPPRHWTKHGSRRGGVGLTAHRGPTKRIGEASGRGLEQSAEKRYSRVSTRSGAERALRPAALRPAMRRAGARPRPGRGGSRV